MGNTAYQVRLLIVAIGVFAIGSGGCGGSSEQRVPVAGRVLIDGEPLTSGTIRFVPESGRPASSAIMADGSFELASESVNRVSAVGVPRGRYRVQVSASKVVDDKTIRWSAPEKYADFRTSGLGVTIEEPTDDLVFKLTWEGEKPAEDGSESTGDAAPAERGETTPETDSPPPEGEGENT